MEVELSSPPLPKFLWQLIQEDREQREWSASKNYKVAEAGQPVIVRVNSGKKGEATGLVGFGYLASVDRENGDVSIAFDVEATRQLMRNPVPLDEVRRVIPKDQNNLGDVTAYKTQIERWLAGRMKGQKPSSIDANTETVDAIGEEMGLEGGEQTRIHLGYERSAKNRGLVLRQLKPPYKCAVCAFTFAMYGAAMGEFIHVHHLKPLAAAQQRKQPSISDFAILCANCHAAVHWKRGLKPLSPAQLRKRLQDNQT